MNGPIVVKLVAVKDGRGRKVLQGYRAQDRWNLLSLGLGDVQIMDDRNSSGLKAARRYLARLGLAEDFVLSKVRGYKGPPVWSATRREVETLGPALSIVCPGFDAVACYS